MDNENKIQNLLSSYESFKLRHSIAYKKNDINSPDVYLKIAYDYYVDKIRELLLLSDSPLLTIEATKNLMMYATMDKFRELSESMAMIQIDKNINSINQHLQQFYITDKDLVGLDIMEKYDSTIFALSNLVYLDRDPIILFEQFIIEYAIQLKKSRGKYRFRFRFTEESPTLRSSCWYYADTISDILEACSLRILRSIIVEMIENLHNSPPIISYSVTSPIDFKTIEYFQNNNHKELFEYLNSIDIIKVNIPLQHLYILIYYDTFDVYKDIKVMEDIAHRIKIYPALKNFNKTSTYLPPKENNI